MAQVTLSGTPSFVQSSQWNHFLSAVELHAPLQNLHWKSATSPSIRTIQQLEITLCSLDSSTLDTRPQFLILDSPLLHIYALICDVSCPVSGIPTYLTSYPGCRSLQDHCEETAPRLAHRPALSVSARMVYCSCLRSRSFSRKQKAISNERQRLGQTESRLQFRQARSLCTSHMEQQHSGSHPLG